MSPPFGKRSRAAFDGGVARPQQPGCLWPRARFLSQSPRAARELAHPVTHLHRIVGLHFPGQMVRVCEPGAMRTVFSIS